jgi:Phosphate-selective porin O and P
MKVPVSRILLALAFAGLLCLPLLADDSGQAATQSSNAPNAESTAAAPGASAAPAGAPATSDAAQPEDQPAAQSTPGVQPAPPAAKPAAMGPLQIKIGNDTLFRFGFLIQPQADFSELSTGGYSKNLFIRRIRLIVGGQITKQVFFFFQTENSRLGLAAATGTKTLNAGFQTIDAVAEWRISKPFNIWGGLIYLPTSREALKGSSAEFMLDVSTYAYTATTALAGTGGRDTGVMARGYFLGDHLEYRAGGFQGLRLAGSRNDMRKIARLQYNFFDTEVYNLPSYAGSYFGTKKIVALGAAYDAQHDYRGHTADLYADIPTAFGSALGTATYQQLDGGKFVTTLPKSNIFVVDGGVFFKGSKLGPWARYEKRDFTGANSSKSEKREYIGLNYYLMGNNFNIKTMVGRVTPAVGKKTNQVTVQLQMAYY